MFFSSFLYFRLYLSLETVWGAETTRNTSGRALGMVPADSRPTVIGNMDELIHFEEKKRNPHIMEHGKHCGVLRVNTKIPQE